MGDTKIPGQNEVSEEEMMATEKKIFNNWYFSEHSEAGDSEHYSELFCAYTLGLDERPNIKALDKMLHRTTIEQAKIIEAQQAELSKWHESRGTEWHMVDECPPQKE